MPFWFLFITQLFDPMLPGLIKLERSIFSDTKKAIEKYKVKDELIKVSGIRETG